MASGPDASATAVRAARSVAEGAQLTGHLAEGREVVAQQRMARAGHEAGAGGIIGAVAGHDVSSQASVKARPGAVPAARSARARA